MVRWYVVALLLALVACGDDGYVVDGQTTHPQPAQPDVLSESETPRTSIKEPRDIQRLEGPDTDPYFIPPYWVTFEPSRLFILATRGTVGPQTERLKINNRGTERVRLRSISVRDGIAATQDRPAVLDITMLPDKETLGPGESTEIEITFYPTTTTMVSGTVSVLTDMPTNPERAVPVTAKSFR